MNRADDNVSMRTSKIPVPLSLFLGKSGKDLLRQQVTANPARAFYSLKPGKSSAPLNIKPRRALIAGGVEPGCRLAHELQRHFPHHYSIVGMATYEPDAVSPNGVPALGCLDDISKLVPAHEVNDLMIADFFDPTFKDTDELLAAHRRQLCDQEAGAAPAAQTHYRIVKRCLDFVCALLTLIVTFPVLAVLGIANKIMSPGPILFSQERVGLNGKRFQIYKLRTMHVDAEAQTGPVLAQHGDSRCTPLGAFMRTTHIDELPQLYNVLRGDMSIVGPRPERPVFVEMYERHVPRYAERHKVLPGLTGIAQTNGDQLTHVNVKLHYDLMYVYNYSLWLDAAIFFRTPIEIVSSLRRKTEEPWENMRSDSHTAPDNITPYEPENSARLAPRKARVG